LEKTAAKVAANKLAPSQANAISTLAALAIKLAELELARDTLDAEIESHERGERARMPRISVAP